MANSTERTDAAPVRRPILQPRFVMGIAMTILSFAMLSRHTGIPLQEIHAPDFNLMAMWNAAEDKVMRVENRAVNDYEHIRLVYQLERRLEDLPASSRPECHGNARSIPPKFIPLGSAPTA